MANKLTKLANISMYRCGINDKPPFVENLHMVKKIENVDDLNKTGLPYKMLYGVDFNSDVVYLVYDQNPFTIDKTVIEIIEAIAKYFLIDSDTIKLYTRKRIISTPRQMCYYYFLKYKKDIPVSLTRLGEYMGGFDHSTVIAGNKLITKLLSVRNKDVYRYKCDLDPIIKKIVKSNLKKQIVSQNGNS